MNINNSLDIIDSRDVIARIDELTEFAGEGGDGLDTDERDELDALLFLENQAADSPDWEYGELLIRDSFFKEYAQEFAEDVGAVDVSVTSWPLYCIDWERAARELKSDYFRVDFGGVDYWLRR